MSKFDVDEALVRKLAALLKDTGLSEIEFESEGRRIRVNSGVASRQRNSTVRYHIGQCGLM